MTSMLLGILCFALLFGGAIRVIRGAIQASKRAFEAQRRELAHETEAVPIVPESEQSHKKGKHAPHKASQPINTGNTHEKQRINTSIDDEQSEDFDLRKAVIASEILRPKFDE